MKKTIYFWMLFTSIAGNLCAQPGNKSDKAFEVPGNIIFNRSFTVDLGTGNKMQVALSDISDLDQLANIDSLLQVFLTDIIPLRDSLADPLTSKRIDYLADAEGRKKIRFQQFQPKGAGFLINKGELASLRTEQDTIHIIGILINAPIPRDKISARLPRYYHFTFYLNDISELTGYMKGILAEKIGTLRNDLNGKWPLVLGTSDHYLQKDKSITAEKPKGFTANRTAGFISGIITTNVQNYKSYFVPSFSLGLRLTLTNRERSFKWTPGLSWEPHFLFSKDSQGKLNTYRNDFVTLTYAQGGTRDHDPRKDFSFSAVMSFGYLVHREGDYFEKNTFRIGGGKLQLYKTGIEPSFYFNNFFKGVTPCIRIIQNF